MMMLTAGAACGNVNWCLGAAATTGASSAFIGNIFAQASVTLGAGSTVSGAISAGTGFVTLGAGAIATPCAVSFASSVPGCNCPNPVIIQPTLGGQSLPPGCYATTAAFTLTGTLTLSGAGTYSFTTPAALTTAASSIVALAGSSCANINWCVGAAANFGASSVFFGQVTAQSSITIGASAAITGGLTASNGVLTTGAGAVVTSCAVGFRSTLSACNCANPVAIPADLVGQTLAPGCYSSVTAFANTGTLTLNGAGVYSFSTPAAMTTAANSVMTLTGGASCANVNWCVDGAVTTGATSSFVGNIFTEGRLRWAPFQLCRERSPRRPGSLLSATMRSLLLVHLRLKPLCQVAIAPIH
jgi:hypothetical protein